MTARKTETVFRVSGSHERFTRQTIVYRIDLFPTSPPPRPPPPPDSAVLVHIYLLVPLRSANHELASSGLPFVPFRRSNLPLCIVNSEASEFS